MSEEVEILIKVSPRLFLEDQVLELVCLIRDWENCCRFLAAGQAGYICTKLDSKKARYQNYLAKIRREAGNIYHQGNNCPGFPMMDAYRICLN